MATYLTHFGLNKAPFAAHVVGANVFVAPQVAAIMAALKKALAAEDAAVCLSGPPGSGKTTIAKRALSGVGVNRGIVTIGRMPFGNDEVLEILLAGLGAKQLPKSTVHRFATFRRLLQQFAEQNTRVFVLVEDASRIGLEALSELEALTAADAGVSNGANLVLLGDTSIKDLLRDPKLARLKQRVRSRQAIEPPTVGEMQGYLKHCFRLAGRDFDAIFADGCIDTLHRFTDGLPRVVNNLVEFVLTAAAEQDQERITPLMIERVAGEEFGLTGEHSTKEIAAAIEKAAAVENIQPPEPISTPVPATVPEPTPVPAEIAAIVEPQPAVAVAEDEDDDIPELIQDTLPNLEILAPEMIAAAAAAPERGQATESESIPELVHEPTENELPVLSSSMRLDVTPPAADQPDTNVPAEARDEDGKVPREIPDWERDPTLAELRPDLEALERAMAVAHGSDSVPSVAAENLARTAQRVATPARKIVPEIIPEITLDKQIEAKIHEATEALKKTQSDLTADVHSGSDASNDNESGSHKPAVLAAPKAAAKEPVTHPPAASKPAVAAPSRPTSHVDIPATPAKDARRADRELEKIASDLARAKTIEDVDDFMAETLFGEEFSMLAAQVAANASLHFGAEDAPQASAAETAEPIALSIAAEETKPSQPSQLDTSPSQRLKVLRDMNRSAVPKGAPSTPDHTEDIVMSGGGIDLPPDGGAASVDSIEDQITTSMTQTLEALSIRPEPKSDADDADEDDDDAGSKGFFGRFRRK
jgi:type II secretory pathway predicted ATPase ExeA